VSGGEGVIDHVFHREVFGAEEVEDLGGGGREGGRIRRPVETNKQKTYTPISPSLPPSLPHHIIRQTELTREHGRLARQHPREGGGRRNLFPAGQNDGTYFIEAATPRPTGHLGVFS